MNIKVSDRTIDLAKEIYSSLNYNEIDKTFEQVINLFSEIKSKYQGRDVNILEIIIANIEDGFISLIYEVEHMVELILQHKHFNIEDIQYYDISAGQIYKSHFNESNIKTIMSIGHEYSELRDAILNINKLVPTKVVKDKIIKLSSSMHRDIKDYLEKSCKCQ